MLNKLKWISKMTSAKEIKIHMMMTFNYQRQYYIRDYYLKITIL